MLAEPGANLSQPVTSFSPSGSVKPRTPPVQPDRGEHPAEPGHDPNREVVVYWLSGGIWSDGQLTHLLNRLESADAERLRQSAERAADELMAKLKHIETLEQKYQYKPLNAITIRGEADKASAAAGELASAVLKRGLELRAGLMLVGTYERAALSFLCHAGGNRPDTPRICEGCGMAFEPKRRKKAGAYKCPACHSTPRPEWTITPERITSVTPTVDATGTKMKGWRRRTLIFCRGCGTIFESGSKSKAPHCDDKCRKRIERGQTVELWQPLI